jgi:hypothetical protein
LVKNIRWLRKNINAEMIEGIDLLTNYAGFALAAEVKKIALNLKTKDSFKINGYPISRQDINNAARWHSNS